MEDTAITDAVITENRQSENGVSIKPTNRNDVRNTKSYKTGLPNVTTHNFTKKH